MSDMHMCLSHFSCVWLFAPILSTVACQAPLSIKFPSQQYWRSCHALLQGTFLTQGSNPHHLCLLLAGELFTTSPTWETHKSNQFSSVTQLCLFLTPWTAAYRASLSITNTQSSLKFMSIESVMPSNHLILWHPLFLLPSIFPSIRVFSNESALLIRWPKYWSFSFSISPSNEHPGLISFSIDWLDLLAVQGTLKSLLQHHSSKASILQLSLQLSL